MVIHEAKIKNQTKKKDKDRAIVPYLFAGVEGALFCPFMDVVY
jgi:hypothetical protein